MRILIVSKCPTHPTTAGNRWVILAQVEKLRKMGHEVHFLYIEERGLRCSGDENNVDLDETRKFWGEYFHFFRVSKVEKLRMDIIKIIRKYFFSFHYSVDDQYPRGIEKIVKKLDIKYHFEICIINYYYLSRLFRYVRIPKKVLFTHDAFAYKNIKVGESTFCITASSEAKAMQRCPHIFALQEVEADYFHVISPHSLIYNIYGSFEYHPQSVVGNHNIVFLSGNNAFNQNGLRWFLDNVFPVIKKSFADVRLLIGGSICRNMSELNEKNGVELQGYVENVGAFYAQADVCINPCYQGTGLKIKSFEAISYDKVTIVHPHSIEGIFDKVHAPLFASDQPEEWVNFLKKIWGNTSKIKDVKIRNRQYIDNLEFFINNEYDRFLKNK